MLSKSVKPAIRISYPAAFEVFLPHLPLLRKWAKRQAPQFLDYEDVIQQTLLQALRHCESFRFESSPGTWLCSVAMNYIRACARHRGNFCLSFENPRTLEGFSATDPRRSPLAALEMEEAKRALHRAIDKLPSIYRKVIELRDFRGLSISETSASLSITGTAVKSRHHRARARLLKLLGALR